MSTWISRIVNGTYYELESRATSFMKYVSDNTKDGLEDVIAQTAQVNHIDVITELSENLSSLVNNIQQFRRKNDYDSKAVAHHFILSYTDRIEKNLLEIEENLPAKNGPFQISGYKGQLEHFKKELSNRTENFADDLELSKDVADIIAVNR